MTTVKFEKIKMARGFWFSAELFENGVLKFGEGCHSSQKKKMNDIKKKFNERASK